MTKYILTLFVLLTSSASLGDTVADQLLEFRPDENNNEVRDDVDQKIAELYGEDPKKVYLATNYAKTMQRIAQSSSNLEYARTQILTMNAIDACWRELTEDDIRGGIWPTVLNTYGVSKSFLSVQRSVGESLPRISLDEYDQHLEENRSILCP